MSAYLWLITEMLPMLALAAGVFFALGWRWQGQRVRVRVAELEGRLDAEVSLAKMADEERAALHRQQSANEAVQEALLEAEARQRVLERELLRLRDEKKEVEQTLAKRPLEQQSVGTGGEAGATGLVVRDELTRIRGIGKVLSEKLAEAGLMSYWQLATLTAEQMEALDGSLNLRGRMQRDRWQEQAQALHEATHGKARG
jgi:predicted flap endonuclease-1-like 5' DNA nuclease